MNKKQVKQIEITQVVVNRLNSSSDESGEWTTHCDVDFMLSESFSFFVFDKEHTIDRIKLGSSWDSIELYYANSDKKSRFYCFPVTKVLIHKVYDRTRIEEKEGFLKGRVFHDELFEMLISERETSSLY